MTIAVPAPDLARTFSLIIAGLCRATASRIAVDRFAGPLLIRIFTRLHRLAARLNSLLAQIQAGPLPPRRPRRPTAATRRRVARTARLPDSSAWLLRVVPGTAAYAGQVQTLLADPQTAALLEAAPQAGRILRPLCRMLAIPLPDTLRRPNSTSAPPPIEADGVDPRAESRPVAGPARPVRRSPPSCAVRVAPSGGAAFAIGPPPLPD